MLTLTPQPPEWTVNAACLGAVTRGWDPWHPDDDLPRSVQRRDYQLAATYCEACPVRAECLTFGVETLPL